MSNVIMTKLTAKSMDDFIKFKEEKKISNYAALQIIVDTFFEESMEPNHRTFEDQVKTMDESELLKLYNKLADNERKSIKMKKGGAWGPQIFYNDMKNLIQNRAPPMEVAFMAIQAHEKSVIINRMMEVGVEMKVKKRDRTKIDWNSYHWKSARGMLGAGLYVP